MNREILPVKQTDRDRLRLLWVMITLISVSPLAFAGNWRVQVMAVQELAPAEQLEIQLEEAGIDHVGIHWRDGQYKVWVGAGETREAATEYQRRLIDRGYMDTFIIRQ